MDDLAVKLDDLFHLSVLSGFPCCRRHGRLGVWHDEHPGLDLINVGVPEATLRRVEGLVQRGCDHVFDADETSILVR
jgi:hypothetical protein